MVLRAARRAVRASTATRSPWVLLSAAAVCVPAVCGLGPIAVAHANCASLNGVPIGPGCVNAVHQHDDAAAQQSDSAEHRSSASHSATDPVAVAERMVGTDTFGPYGCEDFVDAAYGRTTANGIPHDAALSFYQSLADRGLGHHETPIPAGALVFSSGPDGGHVDLSRGDGTYVSGGVQGISPGYGDGHNIQILPAPNLGSWTLEGWAYPPWQTSASAPTDADAPSG